MSQIFKKHIDGEIFFEFITKYANKKNNNEYIFNHISYKKANYNNDTQKIINYLLEYYHKSKQFYLTRNMNYKNFVTIIRQVCNFFVFLIQAKYCIPTLNII